MDKESVLLDSEDRMDKALGALDRDFSRLRTGRASTGLVDNIKVDYYGTPTPISQLASVAIPDSRTITIQPWDRGAFASVEKAILKSDLGLTPVNDGKIIRISIPPLTEDRRKELGKLARKSGEEAKVAAWMWIKQDRSWFPRIRRQLGFLIVIWEVMLGCRLQPVRKMVYSINRFV